jgi:hypothetical protein
MDNKNFSSRFCGDALFCVGRSLGDILFVPIDAHTFFITNVAAMPKGKSHLANPEPGSCVQKIVHRISNPLAPVESSIIDS